MSPSLRFETDVILSMSTMATANCKPPHVCQHPESISKLEVRGSFLGHNIECTVMLPSSIAPFQAMMSIPQHIPCFPLKTRYSEAGLGAGRLDHGTVGSGNPGLMCVLAWPHRCFAGDFGFHYSWYSQPFPLQLSRVICLVSPLPTSGMSAKTTFPPVARGVGGGPFFLAGAQGMTRN